MLFKRLKCGIQKEKDILILRVLTDCNQNYNSSISEVIEADVSSLDQRSPCQSGKFLQHSINHFHIIT